MRLLNWRRPLAQGGQGGSHSSGRPLIIGLVMMLVLGAGVFAWGRTITSPAQATADAAAPIPSVLTAEVTEQVLVRQARFRGDLELADRVDVSLAASGDERSVITSIAVSPGQQVGPGALLASVNGVPAIACPGAFPLYRTITPQAQGPDVALLQACLVAAGHLDAASAGALFNRATQEAAQRLFSTHGYDLAQTVDPAAREAAEAAGEAVLIAEQAVGAAERALKAAREGRATDPDATEPSDIPDQQPDIAPSLDDLEQQLAEAHRVLDSAQADRDGARALVGPQLQPSMVRMVPSLPRTVAAVTVSVGGQVSGDDSQPAIALASGVTQLVTEVEEADPETADLAVGDEVTVEIPGGSIAGAIATIETVASSDGAAADAAGTPSDPPGNLSAARRRIVVAFDERAPNELVGANLLVTADLEGSENPVTTVPITAVQADGSGQAYVEVVSSPAPAAEDDRQRVDVRVGLEVDGTVEVEAVRDSLRPGQLVVIGLAPR